MSELATAEVAAKPDPATTAADPTAADLRNILRLGFEAWLGVSLVIVVFLAYLLTKRLFRDFFNTTLTGPHIDLGPDKI